MKSKLFCTMVCLFLALIFLGSKAKAAFVFQEIPPRPLYDEGRLYDAIHPGYVPQKTNLNILPANAEGMGWNRMAFQTLRDGNWEIYLFDDANSAGGGQIRLTSNGRSDVHPRLNYDATRIVFAARQDSYQIFSMNVDGSNQQQLTTIEGDNLYPSWSPDGNRILFTSDQNGQPEVYVMNADGSGQTRLTSDTGYDGQASFSPDGSKIVFVSQRLIGYRIWVMNADGSNAIPLSNQANSAHPVWSPATDQIAYDADGDNDGWQEIWVMNADGTNQHMLYESSEANTETYVWGWRNGGTHITYTKVTWILYNENWYWTTAYVSSLPTINGDVGGIYTGFDTDWNPDYRSPDHQPPTITMQSLPALSPAHFQVSWEIIDGESGASFCMIQVKGGIEGDWTDWVVPDVFIGPPKSPMTFTGVAGHTYYFRSRAKDNAGNWSNWPAAPQTFTRVDDLPPITQVLALPEFTRGQMTIVAWEGRDPGNSGIATYDIQLRYGAGGEWQNWFNATTITNSLFTASSSGETAYFRSRGVDTGGNIEAWPLGDGNTHTTFYDWILQGSVTDNRGVPLSAVSFNLPSNDLGGTQSDVVGSFLRYIKDMLYQLSMVKNGYGATPSYIIYTRKSIENNFYQDTSLKAALPPANNLIQNWEFEQSETQLTGWHPNNEITPTITHLHHGGNYAAMLGESGGFTPRYAITTDTSSWDSLSQLASDSQGNIHAFWNSGNGLSYASRDTQGTWSPTTVIMSDEFSWFETQLFVDSEDTLHLVWANQNQIYYSNHPSGQSWSSPYPVGTRDSWLMSSVLGNDGTIHVMWADSYTAQQLSYRQRQPNGIWLPMSTFPLPPFTGEINSLTSELGTQGILHVVWQIKTSTNVEMYYSQRNTAGIWSTGQKILPGGYDSTWPQILAEPDGRLSLIFMKDSEAGGRDIVYLGRSANGVWTQPFILSKTLPENPQIILDRFNQLHAAWLENGQIMYASRSLDGKWSNPKSIFTVYESGGLIGSFKMVLSKDDMINFSWQIAGTSPSIEYIWCDLEGSCSTHQPVAGIEGFSSLVNYSFIVGPNNQIHAAYYTGDVNDNEIYYVSQKISNHKGDSSISQSFAIPDSMINPTLSLFYQLNGAFENGGSSLSILVDNSISTTMLYTTSQNTPDWFLQWFDLSPWQGQSITVTLSIHESHGFPRTAAYLDEISVGSAYPDVWVDVETSTPTAIPGEQITYTISYGNRGGTNAENITITSTLPTGLSFLSASITPTISGSLLSWDVGNMTSFSNVSTITVSAIVTPNVSRGQDMVIPVGIQTTSAELESQNNHETTSVFIGKRIFLPIFIK